jgi:hypothetical protein
MQTQDEKLLAIDAADKEFDPAFARDEHNANLIRTFIEQHAGGHWTKGNIHAATRHYYSQLHWVTTTPNAPATPAPPSQEDINIALASQLAAEEEAAEQAREERAAKAREKASEGRMAQVRGKYSQGSNEVIVKPTGYKERRGVDSHAQKRDTSAPAVTGQIQSVFVKDKLDLDATTDADLRKATPAQVLDFTKRLRARGPK